LFLAITSTSPESRFYNVSNRFATRKPTRLRQWIRKLILITNCFFRLDQDGGIYSVGALIPSWRTPAKCSLDALFRFKQVAEAQRLSGKPPGNVRIPIARKCTDLLKRYRGLTGCTA
jgi:hypothetical protein